MPDRPTPAVRIGELQVRTPGRDAAAGRAIAEGIGPGLAQRLRGGAGRSLGAMNLRVRVHAGASSAETSEAIADAIARGVRGSRAAR